MPIQTHRTRAFPQARHAPQRLAFPSSSGGTKLNSRAVAFTPSGALAKRILAEEHAIARAAIGTSLVAAAAGPRAAETDESSSEGEGAPEVVDARGSGATKGPVEVGLDELAQASARKVNRRPSSDFELIPRQKAVLALDDLEEVRGPTPVNFDEAAAPAPTPSDELGEWELLGADGEDMPAVEVKAATPKRSWARIVG